MQRLRHHIHNNSFAWASFLALALVFVFGMKLHIHVHDDHLHDDKTDQHAYQVDHHSVHLGNAHDAEHGFAQHHTDNHATAIDISPEGLFKNISMTLLAIAFICTIVLRLSSRILALPIRYYRHDVPLIRRGHAPPPQLRAPPL